MDNQSSQKQKILFVEDSTANAKVVEALFSECNYDVVYASNSTAALECIQQCSFDLIILDVLLPGMSGYEICQWIKKMPEREDIPVIFLSSLSDTDEILRGYEVGGVDYIIKPFAGFEFLSRVRAHLEYRKGRKILENQNRVLVEHEAELIEVLQSVGSGLVLVGREDGLIRYVNRCTLSLFDEPEEALKFRSIHEFFVDDRGIPLTQTTHECRFKNRFGQRMSVICRVIEVPFNGERCSLINFIDISDRKRIELLKEDMNRIVQHDLKSPLNAIMTLPDILRELVDFGEYESEILDLIGNAGTQILDMINLSLDLYKMESGAYSISIVPVGTIDIINKIVRENERMISKVNSDVEISVDGVPVEKGVTTEVYMAGEKLPCYSMLSNLIKNAYEACCSGEPINVDIIEDEKNVLISIHNSCCVPKEIRDSLFFDKYITVGKEKGIGFCTYCTRLIAESLVALSQW